MKEFITIEQNIQTEIVEKKSKFIANLFPVSSIEEADIILKNTKKKYYDAKHNCIAYRILENEKIIEKSSDDGEPAGTAGSPMLKILQTQNIVNVLIIVTRYFGGILLGTGGLVKAYSTSLLKAIEASKKIKKIQGIEMNVNLDYIDFEKFKYYCRKNNINIINIEYLENITCKIEMELKNKDKFMEDFQTKKLKMNKIEGISIKYIDKVNNN